MVSTSFIVLFLGVTVRVFCQDSPQDPIALDLIKKIQLSDSQIPSAAESLFCPPEIPEKLPTVLSDLAATHLNESRAYRLKSLFDEGQTILRQIEEADIEISRLRAEKEQLHQLKKIVAALNPKIEEAVRYQFELRDDAHFLRNFQFEQSALQQKREALHLRRKDIVSGFHPPTEDDRVHLRKILIEALSRLPTLRPLISSSELNILREYPIHRDPSAFDEAVLQMHQRLRQRDSVPSQLTSAFHLMEAFDKARMIQEELATVESEIMTISNQITERTNRLQALVGEPLSESSLLGQISYALSVRVDRDLPPARKRAEELQAERRDHFRKHGGNFKSVIEIDYAIARNEEAVGKIDKTLMETWGTYVSKRKKLIKEIQLTNSDIEKFRTSHPIYPQLIQIRDEEKLLPFQKALWAQLKSGRRIDFQLMNQAYLEAELSASGQGSGANEVSDLESKLDGVVNASNKYQPLSALKKNHYEPGLEQLWGSAGVYNKDSVTVVDVLRNGKRQCFSGTNCFHLYLRTLLGLENYRDQNSVVIFTSGHILPGQMIKNENGDWLLFGYESTVKGIGLVPFGPTTKLSDGVRVVDPELYFLGEIFRDSMTDFSVIGDEMLAVASKKYGIDLSKFTARDIRSLGNVKGKRNVHPLAFGNSDTPEGDSPSVEADWIDPDELIAGKVAALPDDKLAATLSKKQIDPSLLRHLHVTKDPFPMTDQRFNDEFQNFLKKQNSSFVGDLQAALKENEQLREAARNFIDLLPLAEESLNGKGDTLRRLAASLVIEYTFQLQQGQIGEWVDTVEHYSEVSPGARFPVDAVALRSEYLEKVLKKYPRLYEHWKFFSVINLAPQTTPQGDEKL